MKKKEEEKMDEKGKENACLCARSAKRVTGHPYGRAEE